MATSSRPAVLSVLVLATTSAGFSSLLAQQKAKLMNAMAVASEAGGKQAYTESRARIEAELQQARAQADAEKQAQAQAQAQAHAEAQRQADYRVVRSEASRSVHLARVARTAASLVTTWMFPWA